MRQGDRQQLMETDTNFKVPRSNGAAKTSRPARAAKPLPEDAPFAQWPDLKTSLEQTEDSRPEAVIYAKALIADTDYPSEETEEKLARHLAEQLSADIDPLPR